MLIPGLWLPTTDGDPRALALYLRHYSSRKNRRYKQRSSHSWKRIVGPGERLILLTPLCDGLFVWRKERYRMDGEAGVNCAVFRSEGAELASRLDEAACQEAWAKWPGERLFTFVDPREIRSTNPGWCFQCAGWRRLKRRSSRGLRILEALPQ